MLAYIFWHWPRSDVRIEAYESALRHFQDTLRSHRPEVMKAATVWRVEGAPWLPRGTGYEDWYLLPNSAGLDVLNRDAVAPRVKPAHDAAASLSAGGMGGLYQTVGQTDEMPDSRDVLWFPKPAGMAYDDFYARLRPSLPRLWRRMMVLGPAPEMCLMGREPLPDSWSSHAVHREPVWLNE